MEFCSVAVEGHRHSTTIYVAGLLSERARLCIQELVDKVPVSTRVLRMDLRAVQLIDPSAFVHVARALAGWRDETRGRVYIEFPERSARREALQPSTIGTAVSTAMSCPMSTSPG